MSLNDRSKQTRKKILVAETSLERMKGTNPTSYIPGEHWKNTTMYLVNDSVTDGNGKKYNALQNSRGKPPANNPDYWQLDESTPVYEAWSNFDNGTFFYNGIDGIHPQSLVRNNSQNWRCVKNHQKTAGNGPRAGSELWEQAT